MPDLLITAYSQSQSVLMLFTVCKSAVHGSPRSPWNPFHEEGLSRAISTCLTLRWIAPIATCTKLRHTVTLRVTTYVSVDFNVVGTWHYCGHCVNRDLICSIPLCLFPLPSSFPKSFLSSFFFLVCVALPLCHCSPRENKVKWKDAWVGLLSYLPTASVALLWRTKNKKGNLVRKQKKKKKRRKCKRASRIKLPSSLEVVPWKYNKLC